jgi:hypothetical protein
VRTTIDLKPEHRARLLEVAALRGEKGFSSVVGEAIDTYLEARTARKRLRKRALRLRGKLNREDADRLRQHVARLRDFWR